MSGMGKAGDEDLELPEAEFSYIGRPWVTFTGRWKAIKEALDALTAPDGIPQEFTLIDVGSNNGYFSLQVAKRFPSAIVIGVEGAVGIGNGSLGTRNADWQ